MDDGRRWVAIGAAAAFGGSLFSGFHFDDYGMLQDPAVVSPDGWARCWSLWQTRPLTWFTFWLNYQIAGRDAMLWHAVNVALHVACALLLYRLLRRMMPEAALAGALIFAVHPVQGEAVDYVYARAIVLSTLFCLLTLDAWVRGREWWAVGWFMLAVLSKEECASLPVVLGCFAARTAHGKRSAALVAMLGVALLAGVRVMAAIQVTGMKNIGANAGISPVGYLSDQGIAILRYLGLLILPWFFSVDPQIPSPLWIWRLAAWVVLGGLLVVAARRFREQAAAFWILAGFILLIPSSSIFPAADLAADRRMYLPMLAFAPAIALVMPARRVWVVAAVLTLLSVGRCYVWASDERLWGEAASQAPGKIRPMLQLSRAVPPERAVALLQDAERLAPDNPEIPTELARVELERNRPAEALAQAGRALALTPREPHALNNRGAVLLAMKQTAAARRDFLAALSVEPCLEEARENLARSGGVPADAPRCSGGGVRQ
jgi:hypothetical protein